MNKADKAADGRLRQKYGLTLEDYDKMLAAQGGGCAICGSTPKTRRLHVDHDHRFRYMKVVPFEHEVPHASYVERGWMIRIPELGITLPEMFESKRLAVRGGREALKRLSVRGVLCYGCNPGLAKFRDNPNFLENAATYLRVFRGKFNAGN